MRTSSGYSTANSLWGARPTRKGNLLRSDMPPGWIGTAFNRWIDDDTFDNAVLIKDENGRVLLDGTQDKSRRKP